MVGPLVNGDALADQNVDQVAFLWLSKKTLKNKTLRRMTYISFKVADDELNISSIVPSQCAIKSSVNRLKIIFGFYDDPFLTSLGLKRN